MRWDSLQLHARGIGYMTLKFETDCNVMRVASDTWHRTLFQTSSRQFRACRCRDTTLNFLLLSRRSYRWLPSSYLTLNLLALTTVGARTQRRTTVGRTPLDEWSARLRDLYLTTHDTHNRQIAMPPVGFESTISAGERPCRSPAEIVGSNPTGGMAICLLWGARGNRKYYSFQFISRWSQYGIEC